MLLPCHHATPTQAIPATNNIDWKAMPVVGLLVSLVLLLMVLLLVTLSRVNSACAYDMPGRSVTWQQSTPHLEPLLPRRPESLPQLLFLAPGIPSYPNPYGWCLPLPLETPHCTHSTRFSKARQSSVWMIVPLKRSNGYIQPSNCYFVNSVVSSIESTRWNVTWNHQTVPL